MATAQLHLQGRRGVGGWGREKKYPLVQLRIYWSPIFPTLQVGFHSVAVPFDPHATMFWNSLSTTVPEEQPPSLARHWWGFPSNLTLAYCLSSCWVSPRLLSFLTMPRFIQLCSPLLHRLPVTGGCHSPIGIHFIFPSALFTKQTCAFGILAMKIFWPPLLFPKTEISVSLQKNFYILCNLNSTAICWMLSFVRPSRGWWYGWWNETDTYETIWKQQSTVILSVLSLGAKMCGTNMH